MNKAFKVLIPIFLSIIILIVIFIAHFIRPVNLNFADTITINYEYGEKEIHTSITDKNDLDRLKEICNGNADFSMPSCGFGTAELVFEGNGKKVIIYPACDSCSTMGLGPYNMFFYDIGKENRTELVEILKKYNVTFPCE